MGADILETQGMFVYIFRKYYSMKPVIDFPADCNQSNLAIHSA